MKRTAVVASLLLAIAGATLAAQDLADLLAAARPVGDILQFTNDYVRVHYVFLEYPPAERQVAEARPAVLYIDVTPGPGRVNTHLLEPPPRARPVWRPGVVPRGIRVELLKPAPPPPTMGEPGTSPPRDAIEEAAWDGGQLILATFRPFEYGIGTGGLASVTTFLSEGVVEVSSQRLRRRMLVQAGDTFWFEAKTRITVIDDYPVGAAILQLYPR